MWKQNCEQKSKKETQNKRQTQKYLHPQNHWHWTSIIFLTGYRHFHLRKVRLNKVLYMKMLRKRCLKTVIFVLESPWKVLEFAQQKSIWTLTYAISAYHYWCCEFESRSGQGIQHYVIKFVCQWLVTGLWFSLGPLASSTNKTDRHDIIEILLKVALKTIKQQTSSKLIWPLLPTGQITDDSKFSAALWTSK